MRLGKVNMFLPIYMFILSVLFNICILPAPAGDYYVSTSGSDQTGDGSQVHPWRTINKAITSVTPSVSNPAKIRISLGTYTEMFLLPPYVELYGGYEPAHWNRDITSYQTLISQSNPDIYEPTVRASDGCRLDGLHLQGGDTGIRCDNTSPVIIDCIIDKAMSCAIRASGEQASPSILHNTITGNKEGVFLYQAGSPVIRYNTIKENTGNAITSQGGSPIIENNTLRQNTLTGVNLAYVTTGTVAANDILRNNQHGIFCYNSAFLAANNHIAFNLVSGITCREYSNPRIIHNTLYCNGNGISLQNSSPDIINNISCMNGNYGVQEVWKNSEPVLLHNCLFGNASGNYLDGGTTVSMTTEEFANIDNAGAPVEGNFAEEPLLANAACELFFLQPGSPCINSGDPASGIAVDFSGASRSDGHPDVGSDEYISKFEYDFEDGGSGWVMTTVPSVFTAPEGAVGKGFLMLRSRDANTYGFWDNAGCPMDIYENFLYRATWVISTDVVNRSLVPGMRLRFNETDFQLGGDLLVNSNYAGDASPTPEGVVYEQFFRLVQGSAIKAEKAGRLLCAMDLVSLSGDDQTTGALFLNGLTIEWKSLALLDSSFTTETVFEFNNDTEGWQVRTVPGVFDAPTPITGASCIGLRSVSARTFGYWESPTQPVKSNKLYRARFFVSTDVTNRSKVPMLRLRINSIVNHTHYDLVVDSNGNGDSSPISSGLSMYELYYNPPPSVEANGVWVAFDLVNLNQNDQVNGALFLDRVEIQSAPLPKF